MRQFAAQLLRRSIKHELAGRFKKLAAVLGSFEWLLCNQVFYERLKAYCLHSVRLLSQKESRGPLGNVRKSPGLRGVQFFHKLCLVL